MIKKSHWGAFGFGPSDLVQLDLREESSVNGTNSFSLTLIYCVCRCYSFPLYKLLAESSLGWNLVQPASLLHSSCVCTRVIPEPLLSSFPKHQGSVSWASGKRLFRVHVSEWWFFVWLMVRLHLLLKSCHEDSLCRVMPCVSYPCLGSNCVWLCQKGGNTELFFWFKIHAHGILKW